MRVEEKLKKGHNDEVGAANGQVWGRPHRYVFPLKASLKLILSGMILERKRFAEKGNNAAINSENKSVLSIERIERE